jgi:hypothetical protein
LDASQSGGFAVPDIYQPGCDSPAEQPFDSLRHPSSRFAGTDDIDVSKCVKAISMPTGEQDLAADLQMALHRFTGSRGLHRGLKDAEGLLTQGRSHRP